MRAITDHIDSVLSGQRLPPLNVEGASTAQWVLMDFGDVVAHVFRSDIREHYGLEKLWSDARRVRMPSVKRSAEAAPFQVTRKRSGRARTQG